MSKILPCLWFNGDAEEAAKFYVSLLPDSRIEKVQRNTIDGPSGKAGSVLVVEFTLAGQRFMALNGGMKMEYTHAVSFMIDCDDQAEVDRLWDALLARWRQGRAMRLAEGSLRRILADRADGVDDVYLAVPTGRRRAARDAGDDGDGQARYRRLEARV